MNDKQQRRTMDHTIINGHPEASHHEIWRETRGASPRHSGYQYDTKDDDLVNLEVVDDGWPTTKRRRVTFIQLFFFSFCCWDSFYSFITIAKG